MRTHGSTQYARCLSEGAQARAAGKPKESNPYLAKQTDGAIANAWAWDNGWEGKGRLRG